MSHRQSLQLTLSFVMVCLLLIGPSGKSENSRPMAHTSTGLLVSHAGQVATEQPVVIFGASRFFGHAGQPAEEKASFRLPPQVHGPFTLFIENGDAGGNRRVSSAVIKLNGNDVFGPSDFNQQTTRVEKVINVQAENLLSVELRSNQDSFFTVSVIGMLTSDTVLSGVVSEVGSTGGSISLPNLADLSVPAGAVEATTEVRLEAIESPIMDYFTETGLSSFTPLGVPKLRIKFATPVNAPVALRLRVPDLGSIIPPGQELFFGVLVRNYGPDGEEVDDVLAVRGDICGTDETVCLTLLPTWFAKVNPADPLDPVTTVSLGFQPQNSGGPQLWKVSDLMPTQNVLQVSTNDSTTVSARFRLGANFAFVPGSPLERIEYTSHFFRSNGDPHGAVDLRAATGTPVFAVLPGTATAVGFVPGSPSDPGFPCQQPDGTIRLVKGSYGNRITIAHGGGLETRYAHLETFNIGKGDATRVGEPIAFSDNTGKSCAPHLHFEVRLNGFSVDPEPLLSNNMALFLNDPVRHPVNLILNIDGRPIAAPQQVTSTDYFFSQPISFSQLQPGKTYKMSLQLVSERLGVHTLHAWTVNVASQFRLTVSKSGSGTGTVTSSPNGIDCGANCSSGFDHGAPVTLNATPDAGYAFTGWGGDCSGSSSTTTITMTADAQCTASFGPAFALEFTRTSCTVSGSTLNYDFAGTDNGPFGAWDLIVRMTAHRDGQLVCFNFCNPFFGETFIPLRIRATRDWSRSGAVRVVVPAGTGPVQVHFDAFTPFARVITRVDCN